MHELAAHPSPPPSSRSRRRPRLSTDDRILTGVAWAAAILVAAPFLILFADVVRGGFAVVDWEFLTRAPQRSGREGGISTLLVSTVAILGVCLAAALPLGVACALLLSEFSREGGRLGGYVRASLDVLAGVPSIVFGLFGNAFFCIALGMGFSILSGGLTLACMVLPVLIRSIELGLRAVPDDYRLAGAALDLSRARLIRSVLLPAAAPGIAAGLLLGIGRALAETAALLFTSGYVDRMPSSLLDSGRALSVHVYDLAVNVPGGEAHAYGSALVLVALLLVIDASSQLFVRRVIARGSEAG